MEDCKKVMDIFENKLNNFTCSHSYHCYKKLGTISNNPFGNIRGLELDSSFQKIIYDNYLEIKVLYEYDYGLGGLKNTLFTVPYQNYLLVFGLDIGNLILINFSYNNINMNLMTLNEVCMYGNESFYSFKKDNENYIGINTYLSFTKFAEFVDLDLNKKNNKLFWDDFSDYIKNNGNALGEYNILQLGNIIINSDFNPGKENYDTYTTKIIPSDW